MKITLQNFSLLLLLVFFTSTIKVNGRDKTDSLTCLKLQGKIVNARENGGECIVELIGLNNKIDTFSIKQGKTKFKFMLNKDSYYALRISKVGYLSKLVCINTEVLTEVNGIYHFEFETALLKEEAAKNLNKDILDFPVAIVHFDYEKDCFSYNKEYSTYIKRELHTRRPKSLHHEKKETLQSLEGEIFASVKN